MRSEIIYVCVLDDNKKHREKIRWEPLKDTPCCFGKSPVVERPLTSHLVNHPSKTC